MADFRAVSSTFSTQYSSQLQRLGVKQLELMREATTGQRINRSSDDPAAMSRVLEMQQEKREMSQYHRNVGKANELIQVSMSRVEKLKDLLTRAQELAAKTNSDLSPENFAPFAKEMEGIIEQGVSMLNSEYLGERLFGGAKTNLDPVLVARDGSNKITSISYQGSTNAGPEFFISEKVKVEPRMDATSNQEMIAVVTNLISLRDALASKDSTQIRALEPTLRTNENTVIGHLGDMSAKLIRIEHSEKENRNRFTGLDQRISAEADSDMATTVAKLSQVQTAYQAAIQAGARVMSLSLLNYL